MDIFKRFRLWLWGVQKPTNSYAREDDRGDEFRYKLRMLIIFGLFGMVIVGRLILGFIK